MPLSCILLKDSISTLPQIIHTAALLEKVVRKLEGKNINVPEVVLTHSGMWIIVCIMTSFVIKATFL